MGHAEESIAVKLNAISEELAELAIDRIKQAMRADDDGDRLELAAAEKRITRARRAVEKASQLLNGATDED